MERKEQKAEGREFGKVGLASAVYCWDHLVRPQSFRTGTSPLPQEREKSGTALQEEEDSAHWTNSECEANCSLHGIVKAYAEVVPSFCRVAVAPVSHIHIGAKQKNSWS